jgi:hypothetical protein
MTTAEWMLLILPMIATGTLLTGLVLPSTTSETRRRVRCPATGKAEIVDVVTDELGRARHPVDVARCTAVTPPTAVTCDRRCLDEPATETPIDCARAVEIPGSR